MLERGASWALVSVLVAVPLGLAPVPANASPLASSIASAPALPIALAKKPKAKDGVTPDQAAEKRVSVQAEGKKLRSEGDPAQAGLVYDRGAAIQGDPILYLDAGDAYLEAARKDSNLEMAEAALERAAIAHDILYFHLDSGADKDFRLVAASDVPELLKRADELEDAAKTAIEELENADDPAAPVAAAPAQKKPKGDGRGMIIGGLALTGVGGAFVVMGVAGLAVGAVNQSRADDPAIYGNAYDDVERKGKVGNVLAGVG